MKKLLSILLSVIMILSALPFTVFAEDEAQALPSFVSQDSNDGLYAHAVSGNDTEAWVCWQGALTEDGEETDAQQKYFFLPSGADSSKVDIYNNYDYDVVINDTTVPSKSVASVNYNINEKYSVMAVKNGNTNSFKTLTFKKSTAESAIYANNANADGNGKELFSYLSESKSNSAKATGAIVGSDGSIDNTDIKKIKGRGNTTWDKAKKPFNITYNSNVSIGGMDKSKKFSLLANYQDASLSRNRFLYDLSDAVGMPYASDSRYVDFYMNGVYYGSYQCCQKIEVGSKDVVNDIDDSAYLNEDKTLAEDFPFLMEVDPSFDANSDYHVYASSTNITIKAPELTSDMDYYDDVKNYVKSKFTLLYKAITANATEEQLSQIMDIDSFTKIYLINELGKNWDSGVSSLYMVYKQDSDGNWKFFASPVWDYDNALGNAVGISGDLKNMGVSDYEEYSGWWCKYKGKRASSKTSSNIINKCANCTTIQNRAAKIWFEEFVPALNTFNSTNVSNGEIYSKDVYYNLLEGSADMNYTRGWLINTGSWIADHSKLSKAQYDYATNTYTVDSTATTYEETFKGEYDYTVDWLNSRAAWLSAQFRASYDPGDVDSNGVVDINDVTLIQRIALKYSCTDAQYKMSDINADGIVNIMDVTILQKKILKIV